MQANEIKNLIEKNLPNCTAIVEGDDGVHFSAIVVSEAFAGKSKVQQQRLVYTALGDEITNGNIHALALKTFTPADWSHQSNL